MDAFRARKQAQLEEELQELKDEREANKNIDKWNWGLRVDSNWLTLKIIETHILTHTFKVEKDWEI